MDDEPRAKWSRATVPASPAAAGRASDEPERGPEPEPTATPFDPPRARFAERAELGRGGMGRVFEAHDRALDRPVAIKQSLVDDVQMRARFEREVRITARLQHPGIVPILDAGRDEDGRPFYVMRKIEGRPLADLVAEAQTLDARLALVPRVLAAVDAAAYAHARGVIHRDIKPWNVLLGPFGETLLIDWGLARELATDDDGAVAADRASAPGLTRAGAAYGTPGFMAPEQARGESLDRTADVYALGATLYHVVTGSHPFDELTPTRAIEAASGGARPDRALPDGVPPELAALIHKAMHPDRAERYRDAGELAEDLRRFLSGQLVAAHRYTTGELVARWLRRHRLAVVIAAVAMVLLVTGALISIRRIVDERDEADRARQAQAARADELLVERADAIVTQDPARALALLKQLPPGSSAWDRAQSVAETAQRFGVGWGRTLDIELADAKPARVLASPDGTRVAVLFASTIALAEPSLRAPPRTVATMPLAESKAFAWIGEGAIAVVTADHGLARVDVADGRSTPLDPGGRVDRIVPAVPGETLLFVQAAGKLRRIATDGGPPTTIACVPDGKLVRAERIPGASVCATDRQLWFARDGGSPRLLYEGAAAARFDVSPDARVALAAEAEVIEWSVGSDPPAAERWKLVASGVAYSGQVLIGFDGGGAVWLGPGGTSVRDVRSTYYPTLSAIDLLLSGVRRGLVLSMPGTLRLFTAARGFAIGGRVEPLASVTQAGVYLVGISYTGVLRSWNLDEVVPQVVVDEAGGEPLGINGRVIWFGGRDGRLQLARLGAADEVVTSMDFGPGERRCYGEGLDVLVGRGDKGTRVTAIDHARKITISHEADVVGVACAPDASIVAMVTRDKIELLDLRGEPRREVIEVARPVRSLALADRWLVYLDDAGLVRRDRTTGEETSLAVGPVEQLAVEADGRIATLRAGIVSLWPRDGSPPMFLRFGPVLSIVPSTAGLIVITSKRTIALIEPDGRVRTYQTGTRGLPSIVRREPFVLISDLEENLALLDLRDGTLRRLPWWAERATASPDGRTVFGTFRHYALLHASTVPRDRDGCRAWVTAATNATLEPGSTRLSWSD